MIIGLDVGGTHTDAALLSRHGLAGSVKVITDASDLFKTIVSALDQLLGEIPKETIERIVLSTTLTTNAVVQKKMEPVGIIVSSGPGIDPEFYRTGDQYYPVAGSIDHRGRQTSPVNDQEIIACKNELIKAGITTIGIIGKFSTRNPSHELQIKHLLGNGFKSIILGHQVSSNLNFPRRIATVHLNAAVSAIHYQFFTSVKKSLIAKGLNVPIHILKADGGTLSLEASMEFPGKTILSGPAASVMGAISHAPENEDTLVLDIGGTTTDIAILVKKAPLLEPSGIQRGIYKSLVRSLKTQSIGVGGDSHVRIEDGQLLIGPERLGPALAFGGSSFTPTDALAVLGRIDTPHKEKAVHGIQKLAGAAGLSPEIAAKAILSKTCSTILAEAFDLIKQINSKPVYTVHEFLDRYQVKPTTILLLGGPAAYLADEIETLSGIKTRIVPNAGVANAIGAALARTTCDVTICADTQQKRAIAPEENFYQTISHTYTEDDLIETAYTLLQKKAIKSGAAQGKFDVEVIEFQTFNIIRGFSSQGKFMRSKLQIKPGLIDGYEAVFS